MYLFIKIRLIYASGSQPAQSMAISMMHSGQSTFIIVVILFDSLPLTDALTHTRSWLNMHHFHEKRTPSYHGLSQDMETRCPNEGFIDFGCPMCGTKFTLLMK